MPETMNDETDDDSLVSLKGSQYFKTDEFDPKGRVFVIAGFAKEAIKNSDDDAKPANVMLLEDEDKKFILKSEKVDQLMEALNATKKSECIGKRIEIYRGKTKYKGAQVPCMSLRAPSSERQAGE